MGWFSTKGVPGTGVPRSTQDERLNALNNRLRVKENDVTKRSAALASDPDSEQKRLALQRAETEVAEIRAEISKVEKNW